MDYLKQKETPFEVLAYDVLKEMIVTGEYLPGERIPEQAVSQIIGVSRSPLRAAIHRLTSEGLIECIPYRGAFVKMYTDKDISDCFEMRILLETYAISNINQNLLEEHREEILKLIERCRHATHEESSKLDVRVHELSLRLCANQTLLDFYRMLYTKIGLFREISVSSEQRLKLSNRSHEVLLESILNGNTQKALHVIRKHLKESEQAVLTYYKEHNSVSK